MPLVPGSTAGPYRIIEPLGRGGMASVFRAYEPALDRYVALKVLPREFLHDPSFAARFRREAQVIARLEHPNIVPIYAFEIEQDEGLPWMAMRLVPGGSLAQLLRTSRMPFARAVAILRGVADALDYAHAKGVVHRDVKPQNVLLDEQGRVYLADFGIARILESSAGLTATGMITGTPQYMAPEQATGTKVGPHADVYALGIVAYEMFTGHVPFSADTPVAVLMKHIQEPLPLPPPSQVDETLLRPVLKATAKRPEDRWPSAGAFVEALESALGATRPALPEAAVPTIELPRTAEETQPRRPRAVEPRPPGWSAPAAPLPVRRAGLPPAAGAALAAGVVVLALAGAGLFFFSSSRDTADTELPPSPSPRVASSAPGIPSPPPSSTPAAAATAASPPLTDARPVRPAEGTTPGPPPLAPSAARRATPAGGPSVSRAAPATAAIEPLPQAPPTPAREARVEPEPAPPPAAPAEPTASPEVESFAAALSRGDAGSRWKAAQSLGALGARATPAVPALVSALGDRNETVRWRAAEALGLIGPGAREAVGALSRALRDPDPFVRTEAAKALGRLGSVSADATPTLGGLLRATDVSERREGARALARIGPPALPALRELIGALKDKDRFVRMEAARALGRIGPAAKEATPALTALSRDSELLVSREAAEALKKIAGN